MTDLTHRPPHTQPAVPVMLAFDVEVKRVQRIGANFNRITFAGPSLKDFGVVGPTHDLRIKVLIPPADGNAPDIAALMRADPEGRGWYQQWLGLDPAARGAMRTYTVRSSRCTAAEPEIDVDFVLHFDADGRGGPASQWAAAAGPGSRICLIGPNVNAARCSTAGAYGGIEWAPGLAQRVLLAGDETAVPAISAILETLPADMGGHAFLEVPDAADMQPLPTASKVAVTWLVRNGREHGELLGAAVRNAVPQPGWAALGAAPGGADGGEVAAGPEPEDVDIEQAVLWETPQRLEASGHENGGGDQPAGTRPFYAWIAGEAAVVRGLRRYLVRDVGIDRKQVAFMGYWRLGKAESA